MLAVSTRECGNRFLCPGPLKISLDDLTAEKCLVASMQTMADWLLVIRLSERECKKREQPGS